ncbi:hypothetical protein E3O62_12875 [Cryobacterium sp. TMT2-15-1]|uniref:hypothetical protein n=1 Tax=Cryobacterium sp. TMT2-15-1 TaxID=1259246 RepID=UPI001068FB4B|nr:hypothetical protein [Cryobacterium sp. TMT2-15-1]TFC56354.1 hypothetical protein E3O62_12875 [Cryobacterium sp. TMT2-15-1]
MPVPHRAAAAADAVDPKEFDPKEFDPNEFDPNEFDGDFAQTAEILRRSSSDEIIRRIGSTL